MSTNGGKRLPALGGTFAVMAMFAVVVGGHGNRQLRVAGQTSAFLPCVRPLSFAHAVETRRQSTGHG